MEGRVRQSTSGTFTFPDLTQEHLAHTYMQREGNRKSSFKSAGTNKSEFQTIFLPSNYKNTDFELQASPHGTSDTLMIYLAVVCGHGEWRMVQNFFHMGSSSCPDLHTRANSKFARQAEVLVCSNGRNVGFKHYSFQTTSITWVTARQISV